jgi:hypothetical protein
MSSRQIIVEQITVVKLKISISVFGLEALARGVRTGCRRSCAGKGGVRRKLLLLCRRKLSKQLIPRDEKKASRRNGRNGSRHRQPMRRRSLQGTKRVAPRPSPAHDVIEGSQPGCLTSLYRGRGEPLSEWSNQRPSVPLSGASRVFDGARSVSSHMRVQEGERLIQIVPFVNHLRFGT